jgi:hypothetical protein
MTEVLHTAREADKLSPIEWANMVTDLAKVKVDTLLLFNISDEDLVTLHRAYFSKLE